MGSADTMAADFPTPLRTGSSGHRAADSPGNNSCRNWHVRGSHVPISLQSGSKLSLYWCRNLQSSPAMHRSLNQYLQTTFPRPLLGLGLSFCSNRSMRAIRYLSIASPSTHRAVSIERDGKCVRAFPRLTCTFPRNEKCPHDKERQQLPSSISSEAASTVWGDWRTLPALQVSLGTRVHRSGYAATVPPCGPFRFSKSSPHLSPPPFSENFFVVEIKARWTTSLLSYLLLPVRAAAWSKHVHVHHTPHPLGNV